jgi:hypothetical protein
MPIVGFCLALSRLDPNLRPNRPERRCVRRVIFCCRRSPKAACRQVSKQPLGAFKEPFKTVRVGTLAAGRAAEVDSESTQNPRDILVLVDGLIETRREHRLSWSLGATGPTSRGDNIAVKVPTQSAKTRSTRCRKGPQPQSPRRQKSQILDGAVTTAPMMMKKHFSMPQNPQCLLAARR